MIRAEEGTCHCGHRIMQHWVEPRTPDQQPDLGIGCNVRDCKCDGLVRGAASSAPQALDAIVRDLADLSVADSPEFRDPGWENAVRALIRRARAVVAESKRGETPG